MDVIEAIPRANHRLFLRFNDGTAGEVDLGPLVGRGVFAAWLVPGTFERVAITEAGALEWPGGLDLCPDALYLQMTGKRPEELFPVLQKLAAHA